MLLVLLEPRAASAHALNGDAETPLPFVAYLLGAAVAVALSFAFVAISGGTPAAEPPPGRLRTLPGWLRLLLRGVGLAAWTWVVLQTISGGSSDAEVGSLILWVFGWIGLALVSALVGPAWSWLDPFSTLHDLGATLARWVGVRPPGRAPWRPSLQAWPAVALMGFFVWLELAARVGGGRQLGVVLIVYTIVTLAGMAWFGRDRWREHGEVFSVWFGLLGRLAPHGLEGPAAEGRVRRRGFGSALANSAWSSSLLAVVAVAVASVIWDGLSQTQPYADVVGDPSLLVDTILLVGFLGLVTTLVLVVARVVGVAAMGAGLIPVATGYLVAHYLGYLLVEGQRIMVALSDPLQQGWDLLGTASWEPREDWLATSALWTIQVGAVVLGHVVGAWLGHAAVMRARHEGKTASQWPLAALMIGMTVLALWSLGQNLAFVSEVPVAVSQPVAVTPVAGAHARIVMPRRRARRHAAPAVSRSARHRQKSS
jgi:hypothetical protein